MTTVRVRIAPSPTGPLHIGTARTALYNYLYARHVGGTFIVRLEDTDVVRSTAEFEEDILEHLHWLGLEWDEGPAAGGLPERGAFGPYRQMERRELYRIAASQLLAKDLAYPCYCTAEELDAERRRLEAARLPVRYSGRCAALTEVERTRFEEAGRRPAIRFRIEPGRVVFDDLVRGRVEIDTAALGGDLVIVRTDGTPLYHFGVVVDDAAMGITHVIRGEDHLSNTPKHILLFRALGYPVPAFAHLPLILNPDRTKMSKRKSQTAVRDYVAEGFVREAMVNYLALLGWSTGTEEEILCLDELVARFDTAAIQKAGAVFDRQRLEWLNGQWIRRLPDEDLVDRLVPFLEADWAAGRIDRKPGRAEIAALLPMVRERLPVLGAIGDLVGFLFTEAIALDPSLLVPKRWQRGAARAGLAAAIRVIDAAGPDGFTAEGLEVALRRLAAENAWRAGDLFMAIRVALTGRTATPPLFESMVALGPERTLARLHRAARALEAETPA
jgi:nondiscriminating glutamyl-tRNA synthetase